MCLNMTTYSMFVYSLLIFYAHNKAMTSQSLFSGVCGLWSCAWSPDFPVVRFSDFLDAFSDFFVCLFTKKQLGTNLATFWPTSR